MGDDPWTHILSHQPAAARNVNYCLCCRRRCRSSCFHLVLRIYVFPRAFILFLCCCCAESGSTRVELLMLHGTFPMSFRGVQYHTPVQASFFFFFFFYFLLALISSTHMHHLHTAVHTNCCTHALGHRSLSETQEGQAVHTMQSTAVLFCFIVCCSFLLCYLLLLCDNTVFVCRTWGRIRVKCTGFFFFSLVSGFRSSKFDRVVVAAASLMPALGRVRWFRAR